MSHGLTDAPAQMNQFLWRADCLKIDVSIRRIQVVSGVGLNAFWISSYLWDVMSLIPSAAFTLIALAAADVDEFMDGEAAEATVLLFVLFGFSMVGRLLLGVFTVVRYRVSITMSRNCRLRERTTKRH